MTDPSGLLRLLAETTDALSSVHSGSSSPHGVGVAADGLITVEAAAPGRVVGISLDPLALGLPPAELAAELTAAVNAALADLPGSAVDLTGLGAELRDIQERASRQLAAFTSSLLDAQAALVRRAGDPR
ncbi:YbaB/EbfC family DNA-binding protein [Asanoa sp. NPDC049573]|uniref:YbaB/EbfC family DNA-binding protein n=1 Tax=Asanoa sp. NPDC049573 TaxID=3155396 RepID=UPI00342D606A